MAQRYGLIAGCAMAIIFAGAVVAVGPFGRNARAQAQGPRTNRLIENERVTVMRVIAAAGSRQDMHRSPQDLVAIQTTSGQIEVTVGTEKMTGGQGKAFYLPKTLDHAVSNFGKEPVDMIVVTLK
jgi:quercetin dioxygenase-like cupin family protein